jgi:hypothetical protein
VDAVRVEGVAETSSPCSAALVLDRVVGVGMDALSTRRAVEDGAALYLSFRYIFG